MKRLERNGGTQDDRATDTMAREQKIYKGGRKRGHRSEKVKVVQQEFGQGSNEGRTVERGVSEKKGKQNLRAC